MQHEHDYLEREKGNPQVLCMEISLGAKIRQSHSLQSLKCLHVYRFSHHYKDFNEQGMI